MRKIVYLVIVIFLFSNLKLIYSQPNMDNIDRATKEVNRSFRAEAEEELEPVERKPAIIRFERLDLSNVSDGVYEGKDTDYGDSIVKVKVKIKNSQITDIQLVKARDNEYVKKAKGIIGDILTEQSLEVDAVTGATITSNAIIGAVENALNIGRHKSAAPDYCD